MLKIDPFRVTHAMLALFIFGANILISLCLTGPLSGTSTGVSV